MKKQSKVAGLQRRKAISGYLFIAPFIIGFLAFMVKPLFQSLYMSFCTVEVSPNGIHNVFKGLANYRRSQLIQNLTDFLWKKSPECV